MNPSLTAAYKRWHKWKESFDHPDAKGERDRIIARVTKATELKGLKDREVRELHTLAFRLEALNQGWADHIPEDYEQIHGDKYRTALQSRIADYIVKILASPKAASRLKLLGDVVTAFPLTEPPLNFAAHYEAPKGFKPTLPDGLKALMLREFWRQRDQMREAIMQSKRWRQPEQMRKVHSDLALPTFEAIKKAVEEVWKWTGDEKQIRDARKNLGLSGLRDRV